MSDRRKTAEDTCFFDKQNLFPLTSGGKSRSRTGDPAPRNDDIIMLIERYFLCSRNKCFHVISPFDFL